MLSFETGTEYKQLKIVKQDFFFDFRYLFMTMEHGAHSEDHCRAETLKLLGDYVTLRIIDFLRTGELRFTELQRSIGDVNSVTLSNRLKRLESAGILEREEATIDRQSVAYRLTNVGKGLLPLLREIQGFTMRYASHGAPAGPSGRKSRTVRPSSRRE
jgi:DNA-binding HxlR family transcriptional regulator